MALTKFSAEFNAFNYAYGVNPEIPAFEVIAGSNVAGTYAITLGLGVVSTPDGRPVSPVAGVPITIGSGTSTEVVTPTSVVNPTPLQYGTCIITAAFANAHGQGDLVRSGDFGLQEAATAAKAYGGGLVVLDAKFFQAAGLATSAALTTYLATFNSLSAAVKILNWSGLSGALAYGAASASPYASTGVALY
jgi:predicted RecA/RadA family phage recombinase